MKSALRNSDRELPLRATTLQQWTLCFFITFLFISKSLSQFADAGGPFIDDQLPVRAGPGGPGPRFGPMFPAVRQIRGGGNANFLHSMTSGSAAFDNGSIFASAGFDSGVGSLGIQFQPWLRTDRQATPSPAHGLNLGLGPLRMYDFVLGGGMFYTDFNTPLGQNDESGWSSAITLGTSVNLDLPLFSFQGGISGYYLPHQDEWGYGLPSPFLSLGFGALGYVEPGIFAAVGTKGTVSGWDYFVYDVFNGEFLAIDLTEYLFDGGPRSLGTAAANLPSAGAIDRVGRYQFGGAYYDRPASATSQVQSPRFASTGGNPINQDRMLFTNSLGAVIGRHLTPVTRNYYYTRRDDFWTTRNFNNAGTLYTGGAYFDNIGNRTIRPYIGYNYSTSDEFDTILHNAVWGSYGELSETITYAFNAGYLWTSGNLNNQHSAIYELTLSQSIGTRFQHYVSGGRGITDPSFGERYVADYFNYGISYLLNSTTVLQGVAGYYQLDGSFTGLADSNNTYAGLRIRQGLGRFFLSLSAVYERYEFIQAAAETDQWVYRAIVGLPIGGVNTMAYAGYQYIDRRTSPNNTGTFTEHLLLFYVTQRF